MSRLDRCRRSLHSSSGHQIDLCQRRRRDGGRRGRFLLHDQRIHHRKARAKPRHDWLERVPETPRQPWRVFPSGLSTLCKRPASWRIFPSDFLGNLPRCLGIDLRNHVPSRDCKGEGLSNKGEGSRRHVPSTRFNSSDGGGPIVAVSPVMFGAVADEGDGLTRRSVSVLGGRGSLSLDAGNCVAAEP